MKHSSYRDGFFLPNELFQLGLDYGELAVYSFLKRCENRRTHQCWPSIKTIGQAVGMSENTLRKYIRRLEERELITTEPTEVITKSSGRRNGNLRFTLRPIGGVIDVQLCQPAGGAGAGNGAPACSETPAKAGTPLVTTCGPLCGPMLGGGSLPAPPSKYRPDLSRCSRLCGRWL